MPHVQSSPQHPTFTLNLPDGELYAFLTKLIAFVFVLSRKARGRGRWCPASPYLGGGELDGFRYGVFHEDPGRAAGVIGWHTVFALAL